MNCNVISRKLLFLKREVDAVDGQRDDVCAFIKKIYSAIVQFQRNVQSLEEDKKVFTKIVQGDLILNSLYSQIRYRLNLDGNYEGCYWDLYDAWEIYKYQVLGIEMPENLI